MKYDSAYVDGTWLRVDHDRLTLVDPATEEPFAELALAGPADADAAVAAARAALPGWQTVDRIEILRRARAADRGAARGVRRSHHP